MMNRVIVVGGRGALGAQIRQTLAGTTQFEVLCGTRRPSTVEDVYLEADDQESIATALATLNPALVVVAIPGTDPVIQSVCAAHGVRCVDVWPHNTWADNSESRMAGTAASLVTMCGLFPGLSGILAKEAAAALDDVEEVHIGLLQSTNADVGPAGVKDMLQMLSRRVQTPHGQSPGFTLKRPMIFSDEEVAVRRIRYEEEDLLAQLQPEVRIAYYTAWSSKAFTTMISGLNRMGLLRHLVRSPLLPTPRHDPAKPETVYLTVEAVGTSEGHRVTRRLSVQAESDYAATADVVTAVALMMFREPERFHGVKTPMETVSFAEIKPHLRHVTDLTEL